MSGSLLRQSRDLVLPYRPQVALRRPSLPPHYPQRSVDLGTTKTATQTEMRKVRTKMMSQPLEHLQTRRPQMTLAVKSHQLQEEKACLKSPAGTIP